jgi:hypothetical protein
MLILFTVLPLSLASSLAGQSLQDPQIDARMNEGMARARGIAASRNSLATTELCTADLSRWEAMDVDDKKAKADSPNYWYEKLSTEELLRQTAEIQKCALITPFSDHDRQLQLYMRLAEFSMTLRFRAENILIDNKLYHEYLLAFSR